MQFARNSRLSVQQKMMKKKRRRVEERGFIEREMCIGNNKRGGNRWDYMHNKTVIHFFWDRHVHSEYGYGICTYTRYFCKGRVTTRHRSKTCSSTDACHPAGPTPQHGGNALSGSGSSSRNTSLEGRTFGCVLRQPFLQSTSVRKPITSETTTTRNR